MDYGMFHVEHGYIEPLTQYNKALRQRNAALRSSQLGVARSYNRVLSDLAAAIHLDRQSYIDTLNAVLQLTLAKLDVNFPVNLTLSAGMDPGKDLELQLKKKETVDLKRGYTSVGVHRADLVVRSESVLAAHRLSRGQQKVLVYALKIAQSNLFQEKTGNLPILMVDDLTAELDSRHLGKMVQLFDDLGLQVFITLLSANRITGIANPGLFHVEHGVVNRTS